MPQHRYRRRRGAGSDTADRQGIELPIHKRPNYVNTAVLVANTPVSFAIPEGAQYVDMNGTDLFSVTMGSTNASIPVASISNGTAGELGNIIRNIGSTNATTGLTLASSANCVVTMAWFT